MGGPREIEALSNFPAACVSAEKAQAIITSDLEISGDAIDSAVRAAGYSLVH
jgi:hypothetical protein